MTLGVPSFDKVNVFWGVMAKRVTLSLFHDGGCIYGIQFVGRNEPDGPGDWRDQFRAYEHNKDLSLHEARQILPSYDQIDWDEPPVARHSLGQLQLVGRTPLWLAAIEWQSPTGIKKPSEEQLLEFGKHLAEVRDAIWQR